VETKRCLDKKSVGKRGGLFANGGLLNISGTTMLNSFPGIACNGGFGDMQPDFWNKPWSGLATKHQ